MHLPKIYFVYILVVLLINAVFKVDIYYDLTLTKTREIA